MKTGRGLSIRGGKSGWRERRIWGLCFALATVSAVRPALASFEFMQIEQVVGGVGGDVTAQAVQLRMRSVAQNLLMPARIRVWDSAGANPILVIDFEHSVPNGAAGDRVLIASDSFLTHTTPEAVADYPMANLIPESYLAAGSLTYEEAKTGIIYWRLSWGGAAYSGDTTGHTLNDDDPGTGPADFGPAHPASLTFGCARALRFQGPHWALSTTNAADYVLTIGAAVFSNNAGDKFATDPSCVADGDCDDGLDCTEDLCLGGCCAFVCDDKDACTQNDTCIGEVCAGTPLDCSPLDSTCREGVCDPATGACVTAPINEGGACDDGSLCTLADQCAAGVCTGSAVDCSALDDVCNLGACQLSTGSCVRIPANEGGACNDGLFCTANDACASGTCTGGGNPCPPPQQCDEAGNQCVGCFLNAECADGNPCTDDVCNNGECESNPNDDPCDDGDPCTENDLCAGGSCAGESVSCAHVNDACNIGVCMPPTGFCEAVPANEGGPCDDGLFCTAADVCEQGDCIGAGDPCPPPLQCDEAGNRCVECFVDAECQDNDICTDDACKDGECRHMANTAPCSDGDPCTEADVCSSGVCAGTPRNCSSLNDACNIGTCHPVSGSCQRTPANEGGACSDGLFCTGVEACLAGNCTSSGNPCPPPLHCDEAGERCVECLAAVECDDENDCTDDVCDDGSCASTPNNDACNDGDPCTTGDVCQAGTCAGSAVNCSGLNSACRTGICNPANGACVPVAANEGGPCDDGMFCTLVDACQNGSCVGTGQRCPPPQLCNEQADLCLSCLKDSDCDDGVACTEDVCKMGACSYVPLHANCLDNGVFCDGIAVCDAVAGCLNAGPPCSPGHTCMEAERVCVPALSAWGMGVMALILFAGAKAVLARRADEIAKSETRRSMTKE